MFGGIVALIIPLALIVVVVRAVQGRSGLAPGQASISLRRFFQYAVLLGLLIVVANGLEGFLTEALENRTRLAGNGSVDVALPGAFIGVGGPLFVLMITRIRRRLHSEPGERDSLGWAFYWSVSQLVALAVLMVVGFRILSWAIAVTNEDLEAADVSRGIVWGAVWLVHWVVARRAIDPRRMTPHVLAGSAAGVVVLALSLALGLSDVLDAVYRGLVDDALAARSGEIDDLLRDSAALFIVGVVVWSWYWIRTGAKSERSSLWNAYVLLIGVLGGLIAFLVSAGFLLAKGLEWVIGDRRDLPAGEFFDNVPELTTYLLIGAAVWLYHRYMLSSRYVDRSDVHRTYDYAVSGTALLAIAAGIGVAIVALLDAATESPEISSRAADGQLFVAAITLLVVGVPLWLVTWLGVRRYAADNPAVELQSTTRRLYLFSLLGIGSIAAIVSLIGVVYVLLGDVLDGNFGARSISDAEAAIGALLAALAVTGFHWAVYQEDRLILPDEERTQLREVVLVLCQRRRPRRSGGGPDRCPCAGLAADGERRRFVERQGGRGGSWWLRR